MPRPLVLVSGFGPFEAFDRNPSSQLLAALAADPPRGVRIRSVVLPVSFARAPRAWDARFAGRERPALCVGLGVASRRRVLALERFAGPRLKRVARPDVDGRSAREFSRAGPRLESALDLRQLLCRVRARGARLRLSHTAGGYVCEHLYHHLLRRSQARGIPGLFVHVLPEARLALPRQLEVVRWLIEEAVRAPAQSSPASSSRRG